MTMKEWQSRLNLLHILKQCTVSCGDEAEECRRLLTARRRLMHRDRNCTRDHFAQVQIGTQWVVIHKTIARDLRRQLRKSLKHWPSQIGGTSLSPITPGAPPNTRDTERVFNSRQLALRLLGLGAFLNLWQVE